MTTTAGPGVQAAKALTSPPPAGEQAVKTAWETVEQLRGQLASSAGGTTTTTTPEVETQRRQLKVELDAALGKWHDALCDSVIAVMQKFLKRSKERGVGDCVLSLVSEARKELQKAVKAFKVAGGVAPASKGGVSRYSDGLGEMDVDRGWSEFFEGGASCAKLMLATVEAAMGTENSGYVTCAACGTALNAGSKERHLAKCGKLEAAQRAAGGVFETMTAEWAVRQVEGATEPYLRLYTLESPLCYDVNAAMREVAFRGERQRYEPMKDFAYSLHRAMASQPKYEGTVFRAMDFRVSESLYSVGAVVTMPHPTSASEDPGVVRDFLGTKKGGGGGHDDEVQGTILVLRVLSGRSIARFSRFPEEKEVLIAANTQFRVVGRPDIGVMRLLEVALDTSLRRVVVVELQEIDFDHWGRLEDVMTQVERVRNAKLLDTIKTKLKMTENYFDLHPVTREGRFVGYPLSTAMPVVDGKTLLEAAAELEHNEQVVSLCCANLGPAGHSEALSAALAAVLRRNKNGSHDKNAAVLLSKGADLAGLPKELRTAGVGLLACACKRAVLNKVVQALGDTFWGAHNEKGPRQGWTVLHAAAARNRADLLKDVLLSGPLAADTVDAFGNTACFVAAEHDCVDALRVLITEGKADVNKASNNGTTPCFMAAQNGHADALHVLITEGKADVKQGNKHGVTPCYMAAQNGHADALLILITEGKDDVNKARNNGITPCSMAASQGHADALRILITEGKADVNKAGTKGNTPCYMATQNGHADTLRILITEGRADVNKAGNDGATPCYMAALNGHADALRVLITEGKADVNKALNNGVTPCYMAAENGHADALRVLITEGKADVNKYENDGATPCYIAAFSGHADALRILITEGKADVNKADNEGITPCYIAACYGHAEALRVLITEGKADVNKADNEGITPCCTAACGGHTDALRILITEGKADVNKADNEGNTPCYIATQVGHTDALRILIKEGKADVNKDFTPV